MADLSKETETDEVPSTASSLFDLRTVIAILFGSYGVLLLIIAVVDTPPEELDKSAGIHMNLWSGIVMLVVAAVFFAWMRLRPNQ
jgi:drug/metabolite transporter (DMT)-like permease